MGGTTLKTVHEVPLRSPFDMFQHNTSSEFPVAKFLWLTGGFLLISALIPFSVQQYGLDNPEAIQPFLNGNLPSTTPASATNWNDVVAFPNITFNDVTVFAAEPGSDRLYVGQRDGLIHYFTNDSLTNSKTIFLDLRSQVAETEESGLLGLAFHPEINQDSNYVYVYYGARIANAPTPFVVVDNGYPGNFYNTWGRLSRFTVDPSTHIADPNSELIMINKRLYNSSHRGGALAFDNSGYLFLSLGEDVRYHTAQAIDTTLEGGVLRIDVDRNPLRSHPPIKKLPNSFPSSPTDEYSGVGYWIPNDNPFLDPTGNQFEEYYAIGLRNPYKMTYDAIADRMWIGEIGHSSREEVNILEKGANYGWPFREGTLPADPPPATIIGTVKEPTADFTRSQNSCLIGGYVYRGTQNPGLYGKYICADFNTDKLWTLTYDPATGLSAKSPIGSFNQGYTSSFGQDQNGEVFLLSLHANYKIFKFIPQNSSPDAPAILSQTGAFSDMANLTPADGLIPYDLNQPFWSDGAEKYRWMAVPNNGTHNTGDEQIVYSETGEWTFPVGTVFIKHFELPIDESNPSITRRLETRFLVHGTNGLYYGITYRWRPDGLEADLLTTSQVETISITTGTNSTRDVIWEYPGRSDCQVCHNTVAGKVLGPKSRQLNRDILYPKTGRTANQLKTMAHLGMFDTSIDTTVAGLSAILTTSPADDVTLPVEDRARSYIDANCSYCHRPGHQSRADFDARLSTPLENAGIINGTLNSSLGLPEEYVIYPGDTSYSVLYQRAHSLDPAIKMPPLAKGQIDVAGMDLIAEWILGMDPVEPCTLTTIASDGFESGWGVWSDGGSDAARISNAVYASSGSYSLRLRDNTSTSVVTTTNFDLSNYNTITLAFSYHVVSFDNSGEDFWLQVSTDGGANFTTVEEWNRDDEFVNNQSYSDQVEISGPFTGNTQFRFRCDASGNQDWVYLDEIEITGCSGGGNPPPPPPVNDPIGEVDVLQLTDAWTAVTLSRSYTNPVVIAGAPAYADNGQTTVRIRNVSASSFEIHLDEWDCLDGIHSPETVPYLVVEAGVHVLPNGSKLMAGNIAAVNQAWQTHGFPESFAVEPLVFAQCVTENETDALSVRIDEGNTNTTQIRVKLKEQDKATGGHANETVSWLAVEPGLSSQDMIFEAGNTGKSVKHLWASISFTQTYGSSVIFLGGLGSEYGGDASTIRHRSLSGSGVEVILEEEPCGDTELKHTTEEVHYLVFDEPGDILPADIANARIRQVPGVTWMRLNANPNADEVSLDWIIAQEYGIERYEIERSEDGILFRTIQHEKSVGATDQIRKYEAFDEAETQGIRYYRISAIGQSEEKFHSPVVEVRLGEASPGIRITPNPIQKDSPLRVELRTLTPNELVHLQLINLAGQVVVDEIIQEPDMFSIHHLEPSLAQGIYFVRVKGATWEETQRVLIH